MEKKNSIKAD